MTVLVVAAHPDDETLGAGATIARLVDEGEKVALLVLADGTSSRAGSDGAAATRAEHCHAAATVLGIEQVELLGLPDQRLDALDLLDLVRPVAATVARLRPHTVITHHGGDLNEDHRRTHRAVVTATRPIAGTTVRTVLGFEVPSSTEWSFEPSDAFSPDVFYDVTGSIDRKLEALAAYADEVRPHPHPRSAEAVRALATVRGSAAGVSAAEAFRLVRAVR